MSSGSGDWQWDYATGQYVRYSVARRCWVTERNERVREPQRQPNVPYSAAQGASRSTGPSSQPVAVPGRSSGPNVSETTDSLSSMTIGSAPATSTLSGSSAKTVSNVRTGSSSKVPSDQRYNVTFADPKTAGPKMAESSSSRTPGHGSNAADRSTAASSATPSLGPRNTTPYVATVSDQRTGLQTRWEVSETTQYPDPRNVNSNRSVYLKRIRQTDKSQASESPERDYRVYRVIEVLLVPPEDAETSNVSRITPTDGGGGIRLRRFVIVREIPERNSFEALAIKTYSGRGVGAPGVIKSHHSIICTNPATRPQPDEFPGRTANNLIENGMQPQSIRVVSYDRGKALDPMARLDYADRYEFSWGVSNITQFGRVHEDSHAALFLQYNAVWQNIRTAVQGIVSTPAPTVTSGTTTGGLAAPQGLSNTRGPSSTAATAGGSTRAASSTSGTTASEAAAAKDLLKRYAHRNSGECTVDQMTVILRFLQEYARRYSLSPPVVTTQQVQDLARYPERRAAYIQQIRSTWGAAQRSSDEDSDEESDG